MKRKNYGVSKLGISRNERRKCRLDEWAKAQRSAHDPRSGNPHIPMAVLLDRYIIAPNGCWEWQGSKNRQGYGIICLMIDGKPNTMPAPRLQWMHLRGKPAEGKDICHTCDNPGCINPGHLWEGTPKQNIHDMIAKGRANFQGLRQNQPSAQITAQPDLLEAFDVLLSRRR